MASLKRCSAISILLLILRIPGYAAAQHCTATEPGCQPEDSLRLLVLGRTGSGKSTSGNIILGENRFKTSVLMESETSRCQLERISRNGTRIEVMDSPGLFDTSRTHEDIGMEVIKSVVAMAPGPHAVLYTVPIGQRYTEEEWNSYQRLKIYFDEHISDHTIVLLTFGNRLKEENMTVDEYLRQSPAQFKQVLKECGNRVAVFDKYAEHEPQVQSLFSTVGDLLAQNGNAHFQSELTRMVDDEIQKQTKERVRKAERREGRGNSDDEDDDWQFKRQFVFNQQINCDGCWVKPLLLVVVGYVARAAVTFFFGI